MKQAFTMIELIFAIVIIGILAAVAIPKLAVTRDDAKVAVLGDGVSIIISDISAYTLSHGKTEENLTAMSPTAEVMIRKGDANQTDNVFNVKADIILDCIQINLLRSNADTNLTVTHGDAYQNSMCLQLQSIVKTSSYPIPLTGQRTVW